MNKPTNYAIREELVEDLRDAGHPRAAAQMMAEETTDVRHDWRVRMTMYRALERAAMNLPDADHADVRDVSGAEPPQWPSPMLAHADITGGAIAVVLADLVGIGGRENVGGAIPSTERMRCFDNLGKGRKHATDGNAWMAAAEEAVERLAEKGGVRLVVHPKGGENPHSHMRVYRTHQEDLVDVGKTNQVFDSTEQQWHYSFHRECYRLRMELEPWTLAGNTHGKYWFVSGPPPQWGYLTALSGLVHEGSEFPEDAEDAEPPWARRCSDLAEELGYEVDCEFRY